MARKPLIRSSSAPYHVFARANNRESFNAPLEDVWRIFKTEAYAVSLIFGAKIHALVLMTNHFHLLVSTPDENLDDVMEYFQSSVSRNINSISGRKGHVFGGRYKYTLVSSDLHYALALKYVVRNPVKAGLCDRVENYPYSSLNGLLGHQDLNFPVFYPFDCVFFTDGSPEPVEQLGWFNQPFLNEQSELLRKALRRKEFEFQKNGRALMEQPTSWRLRIGGADAPSRQK